MSGAFLGGVGLPFGLEARYGKTESVSLAFVTVLRVLPPRRLAVLMLRDVLGFRAGEVAGMLDAAVESVCSALERVRAALRRRLVPAAVRDPPWAVGSSAGDAVVAGFVRAGEPAGMGAPVALLTGGVFVSVLPVLFGCRGRDVVARFCGTGFGAGRGFGLVLSRADEQSAFGACLRDAGGISRGVGLCVLTLTGDRICAMTRFGSRVLSWFGLPRSLPGR
jgi:RNA polymerase sigma-70 factor (ECF subfamily)